MPRNNRRKSPRFGQQQPVVADPAALFIRLHKVGTDDDDWASLSALGDHLYRTDPSFDSRSYGFGKLSDLVKAQPFLETKSASTAGGGGQLRVRLKGRRSVAKAPTKKAVKKAAKKVAAKKSTKNAAPKTAAWE
jgi:hypothetical protein